MFQIALATSPYGITVSSPVFLALAALLLLGGIFILVNPKAFVRWGRGKNYSGREPSPSAILAARLVGLAVIAMVVVAYLSTQRGG